MTFAAISQTYIRHISNSFHIRDGFRSSTYANDLVFGTGCKVPPIWAEADASDVQIAILVRVIVLQMTDLLASVDIKDLRAAIAASGNKSTIVAEANAADHALMREIMDELDVEST